MYGEDSSGRRVSLLNGSSSNITTTQKSFSQPKLPNRSRISISSVSSCTSRDTYVSSPSTSSSGSPRQNHSPPTPQLVRLDSQSSVSQSTPSPMTPSNGFDMMDGQHSKKTYNDILNGNANGLPYYTHPNFARSNGNGFPTLHEASQQPYYNLESQQPLPTMNGYSDDLFQPRGTLQPLQTQLQHTYNTNTSPILPTPSTATSINTPSNHLPPISATIKSDPNTPITTSLNPSTTATANGQTASASNKNPPAKKKYPCPHAARHNCTDTFTTSGHAARHGKKHTGEKNILCPTCKKAFTRKDNMKQHERTHKNSHSKGSSVAGSPIITSAKGSSRRASASAGADAMDVDSDGNNGLATTDPPSSNGRAARPKMPRSELSEIMEGMTRDEDADADGEGESPGLDALATAATELA